MMGGGQPALYPASLRSANCTISAANARKASFRSGGWRTTKGQRRLTRKCAIGVQFLDRATQHHTTFTLFQHRQGV